MSLLLYDLKISQIHRLLDVNQGHLYTILTVRWKSDFSVNEHMKCSSRVSVCFNTDGHADERRWVVMECEENMVT